MELDTDDVLTIKHAILEHKGIMLLSFFMNSFIFGGLYFSLIYKNSDHNGWPIWLIYLLLSIPIFSFISTILSLKDLFADLKENKKNTVKSQCKRIILNSEGGDVENLWIEESKQIEMSSFDTNKYRDILPENQVFDCEIHIAPKSEIILKFIKVNE